MKKYILTTLLSLTFSNVIAQSKLDSLSYNDTQDINIFKKIKNRTVVKKYTTVDGDIIKLGDTVILGNPTSNETNTNYTGSTNSRSTYTKTYDFIKYGRPNSFGDIIIYANGDLPAMVNKSLKNTKVIVKEMKAYHRGSKKKPLYVVMILGEINKKAFGINKFLSVMDTELAVESGEILLKNRKMTRHQAIDELKEAKELLDIGVMSKEEFEALKSKLKPIIKTKT